MMPCLRGCLVLLLACVEGGASANAADTSKLAQSAIERVSDSELAQQRGGFVWQGLDIRFGAEVRSYLDNQLVLQTNVSWTATGVSSDHTVGGGTSPSAPSADLRSAMATAGGLSIALGSDSMLVGSQGRTAFVQRTDGTIQNIVLNTASNVDLRQQIEARLDINGFEPFATNVLAARVGAALVGVRVLGGAH